MQYEHYKYHDTAFGGVFNRNNIKEVSEIKVKGEPECYKSMYRFSVDLKEHVEHTKSITGYKGNCYCDYFIIDIDSDTGKGIDEKYKAIS